MKLHKRNGILTITLDGTAIISQVTADHNMLCSWLKKGDVQHIIVKLAELTELDTAWLQLLLVLAKMAETEGIEFKYEGQSEELDRLMGCYGQF